MTAISPTDFRAVTEMSDEMFEAELYYEVSLAVAKSLLSKDLLTGEEYRVMDTKLREKYRPVFGVLFSQTP